MKIRLFTAGYYPERNPHIVTLNNVNIEDIDKINVKIFGFEEYLTLYLKNGNNIKVDITMADNYDRQKDYFIPPTADETPREEYELLTPVAIEHWNNFNRILEGTEYNKHTHGAWWIWKRAAEFKKLFVEVKGMEKNVKFFNDKFVFVLKNGKEYVSEFSNNFGRCVEELYLSLIPLKKREKIENNKFYKDDLIKRELGWNVHSVGLIVGEYNSRKDVSDDNKIVEVYVYKRNGDNKEKIYG